MGSSPVRPEAEELSGLIGELRLLIRSARQVVARSVDTIQVLTNFEIGRRIVEYEQKGEKRAEYGKALLKKLSAALTKEFGRGFSEDNLSADAPVLSGVQRATDHFRDSVSEMAARDEKPDSV